MYSASLYLSVCFSVLLLTLPYNPIRGHTKGSLTPWRVMLLLWSCFTFHTCHTSTVVWASNGCFTSFYQEKYCIRVRISHPAHIPDSLLISARSVEVLSRNIDNLSTFQLPLNNQYRGRLTVLTQKQTRDVSWTRDVMQCMPETSVRR